MPELKSSCDIDLSFPYHRKGATAARLAQIDAYLREVPDRSGTRAADQQAMVALEQQLAELFGFPAAAWFPSGTMAQCVAARLHAQHTGNHTIALHPTSHLLLHEADAYREVHGLEVRTIGSWDAAVTAADIPAAVGCVLIELPQRHNGGLLPDWAELQAVKAQARALDVPLHMDGARLWTCRPHFGQRPYAEIADGFDSVYVSLYKDVGALYGAVLLGRREFVSAAEVWRTRMGGTLVAPWPAVHDAARLLPRRLPQFDQFVAQAKRLAKSINDLADVRLRPNPPQTNQFHMLLECDTAAAEAARDQVARSTGVWLADYFFGRHPTVKAARSNSR